MNSISAMSIPLITNTNSNTDCHDEIVSPQKETGKVESDIMDFDTVCKDIIEECESSKSMNTITSDPGKQAESKGLSMKKSYKRKHSASRIQINPPVQSIPVIQNGLISRKRPKLPSKVHFHQTTSISIPIDNCFISKNYSHNYHQYEEATIYTTNVSTSYVTGTNFAVPPSPMIRMDQSLTLSSSICSQSNWTSQVNEFLESLEPPPAIMDENNDSQSDLRICEDRDEPHHPFPGLFSQKTKREDGKSFKEFLKEWRDVKGNQNFQVGDVIKIWDFANHNERSLWKLFRKERPRSRNHIRFILVQELSSNLKDAKLPLNISIKELLDATVDYFMGATVSDECPKKQEESGQRLDNSEFDTYKECRVLVQQLQNFNRREDKIEFPRRFETLEHLRSLMKDQQFIRKCKPDSSACDFYTKVINYILAHVGMNSFILKRLYRTYGLQFVEKFVFKKIAPLLYYMPEEVKSIVPCVLNFYSSQSAGAYW